MINYLDGSHELPTVEEARQVEDAIICILKEAKDRGHRGVIDVSSPMLFDEDAVGHAIRIKVELQGRIDELEILVNGSRHPENIAGYRDELNSKREELNWVNSQLRELKKRHVKFLEQRIRLLELDLESPVLDAHEDVEMRALVRRANEKIEIIKTELLTL